MPDSILSISNDICPTLSHIASVAKDETQCFNSNASGFNTAHQSSSSQGSGEVSSKFNGKCAEMPLINGMEKSESCNQLLLPDYFQELRKLEELLNLDDDEVDSFVSSEKNLLPCCSFNVEWQELLVQETRTHLAIHISSMPVHISTKTRAVRCDCFMCDDSDVNFAVILFSALIINLLQSLLTSKSSARRIKKHAIRKYVAFCGKAMATWISWTKLGGMACALALMASPWAAQADQWLGTPLFC
ncbi:hypothetical protein ZIOFF_016114 [Zingiber officinale]|uniref:Uncharacterized protein n=1 Tax=Zingiber officinale TaxID=94328 RepID=A0A8J5HJV3_ZINOF|nr:hypothetical protein ZIOFF_016114 [Zingiber officinale]